MRSKCLSVLLALSLTCLPCATLSFAAPSGNVDLAAGVRNVEEGDFEAAVVVLDRAVQALAKQKGASKELARAYLYLAIANLGMSQEASAKARLLDALASDKELSLSPDDYPPKVIKLFDEVRREAGIAAKPTAKAKPEVAYAKPKQGGGHKKLYILGGVVVAGAAVALGTGVMGGNTAPTAGPIVIDPPGQVPISALTELKFTAPGASDPDGDPLGYWWDFGDDNSEDGQMVLHTYQRPGAFTVSLVVNDGKKDSAPATAPIQVKDIAGVWRGSMGGGSFTLNLTQDKLNVMGTFRDNSGDGSVNGILIKPRNIELTIRQGLVPLVLPGEISPDGNSIVGNSLGRPFTLTRQ